ERRGRSCRFRRNAKRATSLQSSPLFDESRRPKSQPRGLSFLLRANHAISPSARVETRSEPLPPGRLPGGVDARLDRVLAEPAMMKATVMLASALLLGIAGCSSRDTEAPPDEAKAAGKKATDFPAAA